MVPIKGGTAPHVVCVCVCVRQACVRSMAMFSITGHV